MMKYLEIVPYLLHGVIALASIPIGIMVIKYIWTEL